MSAKPDEAPAPPAKSKKLLLIIGVAVVVLALAGGAAWFYVSKQRAAVAEGGEEMVTKPEPRDPPSYLPIDNMVVNLADPGGEKVAQIGITFELSDARAGEKVKQYLPTIRSGVLLLISQRTSEELLQREGKEKLAADILQEASRPFGGGQPPRAADKAKKSVAEAPKTPVPSAGHDELPVRRVLFSSFIVQ